jgi:hypothetical protein
MAHNRTLRVAKLVKFGQKTKFILILLDNYSVQMYRFRTALSKFLLPILWLALFVLCIAAPYFPNLVATYYTAGLFYYWTNLLRYLFGRIPFAIGEFVYMICIISLIINILKHITSLKNFNTFWQKIRFIGIKFIGLIVQLYVIFHLLWGLNYLQPDVSISYNLNVQPPKNAQIALDEMNVLTYELIAELNQAKAELGKMNPNEMDFSQLSARIQAAYSSDTPSNNHNILRNPSLKKAVFPSLGDYFGYLAFYQPITGEAIIRADLPVLTQPYTIAHEMAHQMGYASETEANFIAYVVAAKSGDPLLRYSMLLQMFSYAQDAQLLLIAGNKGFESWKGQIAKNKALLNPAVIKDRAEIKAFFSARAGKEIQASAQLYDQFLKWNKQAAGLGSYSEVLKWVRAYRIKTGSSTSYSR